MQDQLHNIVYNSPTNKHAFNLKQYPAVLDWVMEQTSILPESATLLERIYCALHNTTNICVNGKLKNFTQNLKKGYAFCGRSTNCKCAYDNQSEKITAAKASMNADAILVANEKRKSTLRNKFGVEFNSQLATVKAKKAQTNFEKYGVLTNLLSEDTKLKSLATLQRNYEVDSPMKSPVILAKAQKTNLEKYGNVCALQSPEIRQQIYQSHLTKYHVKLFPKKIYNERQIKLLSDPAFLAAEVGANGIAAVASKFDIHIDRIKFRMDEWGIDYDKNFTVIEEFIKKFLDNNNITYSYRNRKLIAPLELDFVCEDKKIAIEVNGLYWHSEKFVDSNYHTNKLEATATAGYRLITIFADEIEKSPNIVVSRLKHIFGLVKEKVGARQCSIIEISTEQASTFLNANHIQGTANASIKLGAFNNGNLVAVMTFSRNRIFTGSRDSHYELIRFATTGLIIGIASKMFKYFISKYNPTKIISYADRRWSNGDLYHKLGFVLDRTSKANYWYTKNCTFREHRFNYTKHRLVEQGFDLNKTEQQIMNELGYLRIYDCGTLRFSWNK